MTKCPIKKGDKRHSTIQQQTIFVFPLLLSRSQNSRHRAIDIAKKLQLYLLPSHQTRPHDHLVGSKLQCTHSKISIENTEDFIPITYLQPCSFTCHTHIATYMQVAIQLASQSLNFEFCMHGHKCQLQPISQLAIQ